MTAAADERIRSHVIAELAWDPRLAGSRVGVAVERGVVTLRGTVRTVAMKRAADDDARGILGVSHVANSLRVEAPARAIHHAPPAGRGRSWPAERARAGVIRGVPDIDGALREHRYD